MRLVYYVEMNSICILGRQPKLGLAELESLYGSDKVSALGTNAALVKVDPCLLAFDRLGGSTKFCKHLTTLETTNWKQVEKFLLEVSPGHTERMPEGKMTLGLSVIGLDVPLKQLEITGLKMKKAIKTTGRNVRLIPNKSPELNTAQVLHNKLTSTTGWELVFIRDGNKTVVAQTVKVQDIDSYTVRDRGRPKRDARVGMLPPKLAQIIINLSVGKLPEDNLQNICEIPAGQPIPRKYFEKTILDPFCGTGVVLQEALLMGYDVKGTDIEQRMVEYSIANVHEWFVRTLHPDWEIRSSISVGDATSATWEDIDFVACEGFLGTPFSAEPAQEKLRETIHDANTIMKKFLKNIHGQLKPGTRLCIGAPSWFVRGQIYHLPLLDDLKDLGYNRIDFEHVGHEDLIYHREDQVVGRELVVLVKE
jgi:SAM-dependent methyltransferase